MFSSKTAKPQSRIDSLIGATTRIEGNVFFSGGLRVDGAVRGNVAALPDQPGTLVVSEQARIDGEVSASHIVVNGTIVGPVHAAESLELQAGSRVKGDVHYKDPGAQAYEEDHRARTLRNLRNRARTLGLGLVSLETGEVLDTSVS